MNRSVIKIIAIIVLAIAVGFVMLQTGSLIHKGVT